MPNLTQLRSLALRIDGCLLTLASAVAIAIVLMLVASPAAQAQTFGVIHTFTGTGGDGHSQTRE